MKFFIKVLDNNHLSIGYTTNLNKTLHIVKIFEGKVKWEIIKKYREQILKTPEKLFKKYG